MSEQRRRGVLDWAFGSWQGRVVLGLIVPALLAAVWAVSADSWISRARVFEGFAIGAAIGLVVGLLLGLSQRARELVDPLFLLISQMPPLGTDSAGHSRARRR